jgi:hypothetical protein
MEYALWVDDGKQCSMRKTTIAEQFGNRHELIEITHTNIGPSGEVNIWLQTYGLDSLCISVKPDDIVEAILKWQSL